MTAPRSWCQIDPSRAIAAAWRAAARRRQRVVRNGRRSRRTRAALVARTASAAYDAASARAAGAAGAACAGTGDVRVEDEAEDGRAEERGDPGHRTIVGAPDGPVWHGGDMSSPFDQLKKAAQAVVGAPHVFNAARSAGAAAPRPPT